jgi:hypothetical protein
MCGDAAGMRGDIMYFRGILAAAATLAVAADPASASESYCVSCSGPIASYVCEVSLPDGVVPSQSPQLYCAYRLAAEGGHASCASRRAGVTPCPGDYRHLAYEGPRLLEPATPAESDAPAGFDAAPSMAVTEESAVAPSSEAASEVGDTEAKTLVELTEQVKEAIDGSSDEAETEKDAARVTDGIVEGSSAAPAEPASTADKIAGAAKTALNCLASWFAECE